METKDEEAVVNSLLPSSKLPQYLATIAATLMSFCGGTCIAWTSPAAPMLLAAGTLTDSQVSWVGALLSLGAALGALPAGSLLRFLGRRGTLLLLGPVFAVSHGALLVFSHIPGCLYSARLLAGAAIGVLCVATPVYIAEIAEDSVRGELGSFFQVMFSAGILFVYVLGLAGSYVLLGVCCLVAPLVATAVLYFMPETPHHYVCRDMKKQAAQSLQWLRGTRWDVSSELLSLQVSVDEASRSRGSWRDLVLCPAARKALIISSCLLAFQQLSGICAVLYFTQQIFLEAGSALSPATCSVVVGALMVGASYCGSLLVDGLGRRLVLLSSGSLLVVSSTALGAYFLAKELTLTPMRYTWAPLASSAVYIVAYCVGFGPLPWTVMAELLPPRVKGLGGALCSSLCWMLSFLVTKSFQDLVDTVGMHLAFWLFALCCLLATLFVFFLVPETRGKSFLQIQDDLLKHKAGGASSWTVGLTDKSQPPAPTTN